MSTLIEIKSNSIGECAGMVWGFLSKKGRSSALEMKYGLSIKSSQLFMALGWLAREEKIVVDEESGVYYYRLANK